MFRLHNVVFPQQILLNKSVIAQYQVELGNPPFQEDSSNKSWNPCESEVDTSKNQGGCGGIPLDIELLHKSHPEGLKFSIRLPSIIAAEISISLFKKIPLLHVGKSCLTTFHWKRYDLFQYNKLEV